jgi:Ni,Fe-hydrogenase III small subunit
MFKTMLANIFKRKKALSKEGLAAASVKPMTMPDVEARLGAIFRRSVRIRQVDSGSCNACEWECTALTNPVYDVQRFGVDFVASPRHADILLVTGPVTLGMAEALKKTYVATPEPKIVIACGDCAKDGGIYKGSYATLDGVKSVVPVHGYIPGCPPNPATILTGILDILESAAG